MSDLYTPPKNVPLNVKLNSLFVSLKLCRPWSKAGLQAIFLPSCGILNDPTGLRNIFNTFYIIKKAQLSIWKCSCVYFEKSWTCSELRLPLITEPWNVLSDMNATHIDTFVLMSLYVVNIGIDQFIEISKLHRLGPFYLVWGLWELNEAELLPWVMSLEDAKSLLS